MPAFAVTYYVDFAGGNDSNDGASTSTPWQLAPGMQGFAGTYTHSAGDQIIFKGGVTWPNPASGSPFPFVIDNSGGGDSSADYYGVDTSWFAGGSFSRPVFDMQSRVVASTNVAVQVNGNFVKLDNIEVANLYWTGTDQAGAVLIGSSGSNDTLYNLYIHNWTHGGGGTQDVFHAVASTPTAQGGLYNSEITGLPSTNSGTGAFNIPSVSSCSIHDLSSGMVVPNGIIIVLRNSRLFNINASFDGSSPSEAVLTTGISLINGNFIHDFASATAGIVTQPSHSAIAGDDSIYNNLIWNTGPKTPFLMDTGSPTAGSANPFFFNNTIVQDSNGYCLAIGQSGSGALGTLTYENNHCISGVGSNLGLCTSAQNPSCASLVGQTSTAGSNILESHAVATANGYTAADFYSPTAPTSPTVDVGVFNNQVQSVTDIRGVPRPQGAASDAGAYEYCEGCGFGPYTSPTAVIGMVSNGGPVPLTIQFDASYSTAPNATITDYFWRFGDGATADTLTSPTTSHTYLTVGNFISSVTITTSLGAQATDWGTIVAQPRPAMLAAANASAQAGSDVSLDLTITPSPDQGVVALRFDLTLPASVSYLSATIGPAALAAGKQLNDNPAIPRIVIAGLNATTIAGGVVATVQLHLAAGSPAGTLPIVLSNLEASSPGGSPVPLNGVNGNITVTASLNAATPVFAPRAYPSPWRSDRDSGIPITFDQLAGNSTIDIFTVSGHLVQSLTTSSASTAWYRTNKSGDTVASGLYFYVITNDQGQKVSGKFVIIK